MISSRKIIESPVGQAETEAYAYEIDTSDYESYTPSNPTCFIFVDDVDKSSIHLSGTATITSTTILTTKLVSGLKKNKRYRLVIEWDDSGNHLSTFCEIIGEKQ